jgi:glycosyltransferase involved in cell wall biosynthesis
MDAPLHPKTPAGPKISIILPTYNRVGLLRRAVASILAQTLRDWELVVMDDASTDGTKVYLDDLAAKDPRVRPVHHAKNYYPDISRALNEGLELARGGYVARLDDDDYWCDDRKLEKQVAYLNAHPDCVVAGGGTIVINENDRERFRYFKPETDAAIRARALFANPFTHSTVMFRREAARAAGGYGNYQNAEDWDLWLRMGVRGTFYNFQEYFVRYLMAEQSKTFLFKRSQSKEILRIITAHRREYPNFGIAYFVNWLQYCYSFLPLGVQKKLHNFLSKLKRRI